MGRSKRRGGHWLELQGSCCRLVLFSLNFKIPDVISWVPQAAREACWRGTSKHPGRRIVPNKPSWPASRQRQRGATSKHSPRGTASRRGHLPSFDREPSRPSGTGQDMRRMRGCRVSRLTKSALQSHNDWLSWRNERRGNERNIFAESCGPVLAFCPTASTTLTRSGTRKRGNR